jgi:uncharacterized protein (TIGR00369 family)
MITRMADAPESAVPEDRIARMVEVVFPHQTNHYGTLFGGAAMAMMDKAAFVAASRHARTLVVTASTEQIDFHAPARHGDLVELTAHVVGTGRSSIVVQVEMIAEDLITGEQRPVTSGRFVMVAVDADGRPTSVPPLADSGG